VCLSLLLPCETLKVLCVCLYVSVCVSVCSDVLGRCVYTAYKARRALLHAASECGSHSNCLTMCDRASRLLSESISQLDTAPHCHVTKVHSSHIQLNLSLLNTISISTVARPFQTGTRSWILSGTRPSVQTVSDACLKHICLLDTSALSALEVL